MARLVYMDPEGRQQLLDLSAQTPQLVIGRHPDCDLVSDDTSVSRRHCIISYEAGDYRVADLGSANGTQVNDTRVTRQNLANRDIVRCGNLLLQFFDEPEVLTVPPVAVPPVSLPPPPPPVATPHPRGRRPVQGSMLETSVGTSVPNLMRAEIVGLNERVRALETANGGQAERLGDLQRELALAGERIDLALGQVTEAESEARELREQLWHAEELLRGRTSALETREGELAALRLQLEGPRTGTVGGKLRGPVPAEAVFAQEDASSLAEALATARRRIDALEQEKIDGQARLTHLATVAEREVEVRVENETLKSRLSEATADLKMHTRSHGGEVATLEARLETADSTLARVQAETAEALRAADERLAIEKGRTAEFEAAVAQAYAAAMAAHSESAALEVRLADALAEALEERDVARLARDTASAQLAEALQRAVVDDTLAEQLHAANGRVKAGETAATAAASMAKTAEAQVAALSARLASTDAALEKMRAERLRATSAHAAEVAGLRAQLSSLGSLLETREAESAALIAQARAERAAAAAAESEADASGPMPEAAQGESELSHLRARGDELEASARAAEAREASRAAEVVLLLAAAARADTALQELDAARAEVEVERDRWERMCSALRVEVDEMRAAHEETTRVLGGLRNDDSRLRSALAEAREEVKAAGQMRRTLREAQAELERLKAAVPAEAPEEVAARHAALEKDLELAQTDLRSTRERLTTLETRVRHTEVALAEAEGRAQEAQTALIQVREAERAARGGAVADPLTSERMSQMNVKLAAVTRRAQLAEEQASAARRLEERSGALESELAAVTLQVAEAESERDNAATTTLSLLAEKRTLGLEIDRLRRRLAELEAAAAVKPAWPSWMDEHLEMLADLTAQLRGDMAQITRQWAGLAAAPGPRDEWRGFQAALESAQAGADSLAEATTATHEAIESLRQVWRAGSN